METTPRNLVSLEALAARLTEMEAAHADRLAQLEASQTARIASLEAELAALRAAPARAATSDATHSRRPLVRLRHTPAAGPAIDAAPSGRRTSRRGMLGAAAKVAAATVAAGVLVEQVGTRAAYADNLGNFSSSVAGTPAVGAAGTNGAVGINVTSDTANAIYAQSSPMFSAAILGNTQSTSVDSMGVQGQSQGGTGSGIGVSGSSGSGTGVGGSSSSGTGVFGNASSGIGVWGSTKTGTIAVYGQSFSNTVAAIAVRGDVLDNLAMPGPGIGVQGSSGGGTGVSGMATTGTGVSGTATTGTGVSGTSTGLNPGVSGTSTSGAGVTGVSTNGPGVQGSSTTNGDGVKGVAFGASVSGLRGINMSNSATSIAVIGHSDNGVGALGPGIGVQGETAGGTGILGSATTGIGVYGTSAGGAAKQAIQGVGTSGAAGVRASSDTGNGLVASSASGTGLNVSSISGSAVIATSNGVGYGLYLTAPSGWAIGCVGRIRVLGAAVGTVTLAHGTTAKTVSSTACSGSSQVILTPTSNPQVSIWAVAAPGSFTIHASSTPASDITFSYLLIN